MEFVFKAVGDFGALLTGSMVVIGDKLGLYRAMAGAGPLTAAELADRTGTAERYVREWLCAQAAAGYIDVDSEDRFSLSTEHAIALTDESSPACVVGGFELMLAAVRSTDRLVAAFRTGILRHGDERWLVSMMWMGEYRCLCLGDERTRLHFFPRSRRSLIWQGAGLPLPHQ
jgi:hypothetical protein